MVLLPFATSTNMRGMATVVAPFTVALTVGTGVSVTKLQPVVAEVGFTLRVVPSFAPTTFTDTEVRTPENVGAVTIGAVIVNTTNVSAPAMSPG